MAINQLPFAAMADQFGTPLYIYDQDQLEENLHRFQQAITYQPLGIYMPLMANDTPALLQICRAQGAGAFVNSPRHLSIALHEVGWSPESIIYASSNLTESLIRRIVQSGVIFHANSPRELTLYGKYTTRPEVGLRLAWPLPGQTPAQKKLGRLGWRPAELDEALCLARAHGLRIKGLHVYLGTNITEAEYYCQQVAAMASIFSQFPDLSYVDLSGGFCCSPGTIFDYERFSRGVTQVFEADAQKRGQRLRLILEPGRSSFADTGYFLTQVVEVRREAGQVLVGVDGSFTLLPMLMLHPGRQVYQPFVVGKTGISSNEIVTICGASTYSRDYLARDVALPPVEAGDLICFNNAGAYSYACLSNYLGVARPAQVLVRAAEADAGKFTLITPPETIEVAV